jgi:hypothetical protein
VKALPGFLHAARVRGDAMSSTTSVALCAFFVSSVSKSGVARAAAVATLPVFVMLLSNTEHPKPAGRHGARAERN